MYRGRSEARCEVAVWTMEICCGRNGLQSHPLLSKGTPPPRSRARAERLEPDCESGLICHLETVSARRVVHIEEVQKGTSEIGNSSSSPGPLQGCQPSAYWV